MKSLQEEIQDTWRQIQEALSTMSFFRDKRQEIAGLFEHYLALLKMAGYDIREKQVIYTENGSMILILEEIPEKIVSDDALYLLLCKVWGKKA